MDLSATRPLLDENLQADLYKDITGLSAQKIAFDSLQLLDGDFSRSFPGKSRGSVKAPRVREFSSAEEIR